VWCGVVWCDALLCGMVSLLKDMHFSQSKNAHLLNLM